MCAWIKGAQETGCDVGCELGRLWVAWEGLVSSAHEEDGVKMRCR